MQMDMCLSNVDVHQGTIACNCLSSRKNSSCPHFFIKTFLSNTRSEFHFVRRNSISIGQSGLVNKKIIFGPVFKLLEFFAVPSCSRSLYPKQNLFLKKCQKLEQTISTV